MTADAKPQPWDRLEVISNTATSGQQSEPSPTDRGKRTEAGRDRDRLLYAPAFRRLSTITQVLSPSQGFDLFQEPYEDNRDSRKTLQQFSSLRISDYLDAVSLNDNSGNGTSVEIEDDAKKEVAVLKELTWQYVIRNPALATVQTGQAQIIRTLFLTYTRDAQKNEGRLLPTEWQERIKDSTVEPYRTVVDFIASLTERQALTLYGRITGHVSEALIEPRGIRM